MKNDYFGVSLGGVLGPPGPSEFILDGSNGRQILPTSQLRVNRGKNDHLDDVGG